jgi:hypothetical protein
MQTQQLPQKPLAPTSLPARGGVAPTTVAPRTMTTIAYSATNTSSGGMTKPLKQIQQSVQQTRAKTMIVNAPLYSFQGNSNSVWRELRGSLGSIKHLYAGIEGQLLTVGLVHSITCFIYDSVRRDLFSRRHRATNEYYSSQQSSNDYLLNDPLKNVITAAFLSGSIISFVTSPLMVVKTKQQLHPTWSIRDAIKDSLTASSRPGLRNLYIGFIPHFYCETISRAFYFGSYEFLKRSLRNHNEKTKGTAILSLPQRMLCASMAGMICWTSIYPMDVLRCRIYASPESSKVTALQVARKMWSMEGGVQPFVRGFGFTILRAGPVAAIVLPVYDCLLDLLNKES